MLVALTLSGLGLPTTVASTGTEVSTSSLNGTRVVQYFEQWAIYGRKFYPTSMDFASITHMHYGFFDVTSDCYLRSLDTYADCMYAGTEPVSAGTEPARTPCLPTPLGRSARTDEKVYPELGMNWGADSPAHGTIGRAARC